MERACPCSGGVVFLSQKLVCSTSLSLRSAAQGEESAGKLRKNATELRAQELSNRRLWHYVVRQLKGGMQPIELLERMPQRKHVEFWHVVGYLDSHNRFEEALQAFEWWKNRPRYRARETHFLKFILMAGKAGEPEVAQELFDNMVELGVTPTRTSYTALLHSYAEAGNFAKAEALMKQQMPTKGLTPTVATYDGLIRAYGKQGLYDEMAKTLKAMDSVKCDKDFQVHRTLIEAYSRGGLVGKMEEAFEAMVNAGWEPDSACLNLMVRGYAKRGMIREMEGALSQLRASGRAASQGTIRAVGAEYIRKNEFHQLGEFAKWVGLRTDSVGNLLWNLVLLSDAANFSMKSLQREVEKMRAANFVPDLTSFNIRALAFSRMQMFWDLHVLVLHMNSLAVVPDLVTLGAVVDAYVMGRLEKKLPEALDELQMLEEMPRVMTDPLVFEAFGKGRFHVFCEEYMLSNSQLTYSALVTCYTEMER